MAKENKHGVTLRSLRRSIKMLKKNDTDGTWTIKARNLCCEAFMSLPKKQMIHIAEEMPTDSVFIQELFRLTQQAGYGMLEFGGKETVFIRMIEEMSELTQAMTKSMRQKEDLDNVKEEIADVENMLMMVKQAYNLETDQTVQNLRFLKLYREMCRLGKITEAERDSTMSYHIKKEGDDNE